MSKSNADSQSSILTLTFSDEPFYGRVTDGFGSTVYRLDAKEGALGGKKESHVSRVGSDGKLNRVADIVWGGLTVNKSVNVGGKDRGQFLDNRRDSVFSTPEYWFTAGDGREFYWKQTDCFTASGELVATYTRQSKRLFHPKVPASLTVDQTYTSLEVLDFIMVSVLLAEQKREQQSRRSNASSSGGAAGGGGGRGGC
ncbi:hypothetical protein FRB90_011224 [Tulasnella sp. 427]|nr:hypothetical protein FRB90_011224 [Tulasnella sp. 427]